MDKEDKQIIDRAVKEEWRIGDRTRLKRLLEKNLEQYRDKVELEEENNKLLDVINNYEVKIADLEKEIEKMKCCYNCSKWNDGECEESPKSKTFFCADFKCDEWECIE